jgi:hypothetical protein
MGPFSSLVLFSEEMEEPYIGEGDRKIKLRNECPKIESLSIIKVIHVISLSHTFFSDLIVKSED